jgi:hypothetical protein
MELEPGNVRKVSGVQRPQAGGSIERAGRNGKVDLAPTRPLDHSIEVRSQPGLGLTEIHDRFRPQQRRLERQFRCNPRPAAPLLNHDRRHGQADTIGDDPSHRGE